MKVECCRPDADDQRAEGAVQVRVCFGRDDLRVRETPFGVMLDLEGCTPGAEVGGPALPRASIFVAVPEGTWPLDIDVRATKTVPITKKPVFVAPVQPLRPGDECKPPRRPRPEQDPDDETFEPFPPPAIVPPDAALYEAAVKAPLWRLTGIEYFGFNPAVRVALRPVRYSAEGRLELVTECEVVVKYGARPEPLSQERLAELLAQEGIRDADVARLVPMPEPKIVSRGQAKRLAELARATVVNPEVIGRWADRFPYLELPADYLVVTDNQSWDAQAIRPTGTLAGDMVAEFQRLVQWKRQRGLTAKVVTITDIVGGRYGNFRAGARDLQEVIRRFLKWAHEHWGVAWVLLGGDVNVVPARLAAGAVEGHMDVQATDPPPDNKSFWTGSFLKMNVRSPGTWWPGSWDRILTNAGTGQPIPLDSTGASATSGLGWYFTTDATYTTRATMPTQFVRVNGPASVCNAQMQWLYEWNRIPTDFYYSSLHSYAIGYREIEFWFFKIRIPYVYQPAHDWDALDNGLYGQYVNGQDVDGVVWRTDVSVGRAPVASAQQARAFVNKVLAYESFRTPDGGFLNGNWPRRLVVAADNWGGPVTVFPTSANPPGDNQYRNAGSHALIKLATVPDRLERQLIADISDSDRRELVFKPSGGAGPGWYYARSGTDLSVSEFHFKVLWFNIRFPIPTQWIVVHGAAAEITPRWFLLDHPAQDGSMADQEALREQLRVEIPGWDQVSRYYKDETDLTPAQVAAAPLQHLTSARIAAALNAAPHVVSLSGHGSSGGCCGAGTGIAMTATNGAHPFIVYADSCLTGQFDSEDAFAEELLKNPSGGAVAYVGSSRFSWISAGDDHQRAFFRRLTSTRHIGLANDVRVAALDMSYWHAYARWCIFSLNLLGDPEMRIWRGYHRPWGVEVIWKGDRRVPLVVKVKQPRRPKPGEPVEDFEDVFVHLRQGEFERVARVDARGEAAFDLQQAGEGRITLTVSGADAVPHVEELEVLGPCWVEGRVACVSHRHEGRDETRVTLSTDDGERAFVVPGGGGDYAMIVNAAAEAQANRRRIELMVASRRDGAVVERFRLCEG